MPLKSQPSQPCDYVIIHGPHIDVEVPESVVALVEELPEDRRQKFYQALHTIAEEGQYVPHRAFFDKPTLICAI